MTTKPGILPREGLYIDPIFNYLRQTLLHPLFTLGCLYLVHGAKLSAVVPYEKSVQLIAGTSFFLWLNDWLSAKSRNNWVIDDSWDWKKELVVVTGGSGGIGGGVAQRLAAMGARVIVLDITPLTYKPVVVNNAGLSRGQTIVEGNYSDNIITLKTNLLAPFLLSKEFLPNMIRQNHGHIFNVASMSAYIPPPGIADYAASKAGLIAFNECLSQELRVQNALKVRTSLAVLSFTKTPLFKGETNQSRFLMPLLHVDTVVDAIVDTLDGLATGPFDKQLVCLNLMEYELASPGSDVFTTTKLL
ncbi:Retinol dehydrogenase 10 [Penicillium subrubescens]|uniref:Retinol dehydrogenase 10 n=1 Tax=Penicillium subrubescens TaxID=1316194 RepID=A0A1Q5SNP0_9EURO|nr:Retinol dehydrogenase 10 [Penicillium subrubescens]